MLSFLFLLLPKIPKQDCGECDYEVFYYYEELRSDDYLFDALDVPANNCALAAIYNQESRRGAQYAIPEGKIAITQGFFPIDDYIDDCHFDDEKSDDGEVTGCEDPGYNDMFKNFDGSRVITDDDCWVDIDLPIPDGVIHAAIGSDGLLRPVLQWQSDPEQDFYFDGAVYECCPLEEEICAVNAPVETRRGLMFEA